MKIQDEGFIPDDMVFVDLFSIFLNESSYRDGYFAVKLKSWI